jgi:hypothetical protein
MHMWRVGGLVKFVLAKIVFSNNEVVVLTICLNKCRGGAGGLEHLYSVAILAQATINS